MFIIAIIAAVLAVATIGLAIATGRSLKKEPANRYDDDRPAISIGARIGAAVFVLATVILGFFASTFTQDVGQSYVLKDWTGNLVGERTASGLSFKAPWVDAIEFDTRNQLVAYIGDGNSTYNGQKATGPQITSTDKEGVTANFDIAVVYSVNPTSVRDIYTQYQNQESFRAKLIEQDIRSVVRDIPAQYNTIDLLNNREKVATQIKDALTQRWTKAGIIVENVALQEIRYSDQVKGRFDAAQQARIDVTKAQAELEATKVSSQQKVVEAQAEADANAKLAASLTDPILKQRYLDTLGKLAQAGNLVITDGTGGQIINLPAKK